VRSAKGVLEGGHMCQRGNKLRASRLAVLLLVSAQTVATQFTGAFNHGVASGDPLPDRVVIWTRISPRLQTSSAIQVSWTVTSSSFDHQTRDHRNIVADGTVAATSDADFTVKVDVTNLTPGQTYFYSFSAGAAHSPLGRFRVPHAAAEPLTELRYAAVSCSNWGWGNFNVYDALSRYNLDFWMHLGDAIYEYDQVETRHAIATMTTVCM